MLVLGYHRIGDPPPGQWNDWFYVSEQAFAEQLLALDDHGWTVIDLTQLLAGLSDPARLPARSALITFDDADASLQTGALSHLLRRRVPAVAFVPTEFVGASNAFDQGDQPPARILDWGELGELACQGVSIQAHSVSHRRFSDLSAPEIRRELRCSKEALEDRLGTAVHAFAFPFGDAGRSRAGTEQALAELGYRAAFLYGGACPWPLAGCRRFALARLAMGRDTDLGSELAGAAGARP